MLFASLFRNTSRLAVFAVGLLIGIQVPSFVDQYRQRIDAHFQEVSINISGFQRTADRQFAGDLEALIAYYAASNDPVFESDAESIRVIADRYTRLTEERAALETNAFSMAVHVMVAADREFLQETMDQYTYTVPLTTVAIQWGLALAIFIALALDGCVFGCKKCYGLVRRRKPEVSIN